MTLEEIRELMTLRGWSQGELARQLGLTRPAVTQWFTRGTVPSGAAVVLMRDWLKKARKRAADAPA